MRRLFLRFLVFLLILLTIATVCVFVWSKWPITVDRSEPDPAVELVNSISQSGPIYKEAYVGSDGEQIHIISAGTGEPILFLHGFPSYWFSNFRLIDEFSNDYQVIAIDGLGVGKSDAPKSIDAYTLQSLTSHIDGVLDYLNLESTHIVGHDWGAVLAGTYAQAHPERVKTLTMMSAPPHNIILSRLEDDPAIREKFDYINRLKNADPIKLLMRDLKTWIWESTYARFVDEGIITAEEGALFKRTLGQPKRTDRHIHWYRANFPDFDDITDDNYWPSKEARLNMPVFFIYGEDDGIIIEGVVDDLRARAEDIQVLMLPDTGHWPHLDYLDRVSADIHAFISR